MKFCSHRHPLQLLCDFWLFLTPLCSCCTLPRVKRLKTDFSILFLVNSLEKKTKVLLLYKNDRVCTGFTDQKYPSALCPSYPAERNNKEELSWFPRSERSVLLPERELPYVCLPEASWVSQIPIHALQVMKLGGKNMKDIYFCFSLGSNIVFRHSA